jgi:DNA-binding NarL/FixJ family response regulator
VSRLVVADDDVELLEMLVLLLEELDHEVLATGRNGREAVAAAVRERPDVVLLDLRMPEMSGLEATELLREVAPELPVVLLSAYDDPGLQERAAAAGVHTYLVKGCSAQSLHAAVEAAASGG